MSNNFLSSNQSDSYSCSSSCCLTTALKTKRGNNKKKMHRSLITALTQESPSSNYHSLPPPSHSDNATHFSTPRNQRLGMAYIENNCFSDIDEWLEHANKFCKSFNHHTEENLEAETRRNGNPQDLMRMSQEHEFYNIMLPSVREESPLPHTSITSCSNPKLEADHEDVRNKAKHLQLMHRLRKKEEAIYDWELHQTRKVMDHMDKIQNELERKQVMASARAQRKIYSVREKAEKQKLKLRRSTMKKFQQLQLLETHSSSDTSWDLHLPLR